MWTLTVVALSSENPNQELTTEWPSYLGLCNGNQLSEFLTQVHLENLAQIVHF